MNKIEEYTIELIENITKEGMSITYAGASTFFKAHGGDLIIHAKDSYFNERFKIRLEEFSREEQELNEDVKTKFYNNINYQQLNYLFELFDKARTSTFDLHAKILSKIYSNLLSTGQLNYNEINLVSNINTLHEDDFRVFYTMLNNHFNQNKGAYDDYYGLLIKHIAVLPSDGMAIIKFINLGILLERKQKGELDFSELDKRDMYPKNIEFMLGEYSRDLFDILKDIYST